jgi:hypothetical protein
LENSHTTGVAKQNVRTIEAATRTIDRSSTTFMRRCRVALSFSIHFFFYRICIGVIIKEAITALTNGDRRREAKNRPVTR